MNLEEAIKNREDCLKYLEEIGPKASHDCLEAVRWSAKALKALRPVSRERVEKVWKGEWKPTEYPYMNECEDCSVCGYRTTWGHGFRFCPACGRAMTDEAMEMVMERLEALKDGKGD